MTRYEKQKQAWEKMKANGKKLYFSLSASIGGMSAILFSNLYIQLFHHSQFQDIKLLSICYGVSIPTLALLFLFIAILDWNLKVKKFDK